MDFVSSVTTVNYRRMTLVPCPLVDPWMTTEIWTDPLAETAVYTRMSVDEPPLPFSLHCVTRMLQRRRRTVVTSVVHVAVLGVRDEVEHVGYVGEGILVLYMPILCLKKLSD